MRQNRELREERVFYGWYVVGVAFLTNFMATGTGFYVFNALMNPLCDTRGWSRTEVNAAPAIGIGVGIVSAIVYGTLVTRMGPRLLMFVGSIVSGLAFAGLGLAGKIGHFYLACVLLFLGNSAMSGIVSNTAVSNWFVRKRGKALGLATSGVSLSGAVLPYLAMWILDAADLFSVFLWTGAITWMLAPIVWFAVKNRPEEWGMVPDGSSIECGHCTTGDSSGHVEGKASKSPVFDPPDDKDRRFLWTPQGVLRTQAFWTVGSAYALVMMGVVGVMFQLAPRFIDVGFDRRAAMGFLSLTALVGAFGKTAWGVFCDRYDPRRVVAGLMAMNGVGLCLALIPASFAAVAVFIVVFGFAMGGVMSTFPILIADLYGRESFASVARFMALFLLLQAVGYLLMGQSYDRTGSYNTAYTVFILLDIAAAGLILWVRRPEPLAI
jgi:nitrate/nitrite transporter NarK